MNHGKVQQAGATNRLNWQSAMAQKPAVTFVGKIREVAACRR